MNTMETEKKSLVNGETEPLDMASKNSVKSKPNCDDNNEDDTYMDSDNASVAESKGSIIKGSQEVIENGISSGEYTKDSENDDAKKSNVNGNANDSGHYDNVSDDDSLERGDDNVSDEDSNNKDDHDVTNEDSKIADNENVSDEESKNKDGDNGSDEDSVKKSDDDVSDDNKNKDNDNVSDEECVQKGDGVSIEDNKMECDDNDTEENSKSKDDDGISGVLSKMKDDDTSNVKSSKDTDVSGDGVEEKQVLSNIDKEERGDSNVKKDGTSGRSDKTDEKSDSEKENALSDNVEQATVESGTNTGSVISSVNKQVDSSNDDIQIIGESKVVQIASPTVPNSSQNVIIIPQISSKNPIFSSGKSLFSPHMPILGPRAYSPGMPNIHPGFIFGGNSNLSPNLSMLPQPVAPPKPKSSLDQIELIRWEIQNRINTRPKYFKPNPTAELGPLSKFLFDIGSDLIKESVYHELVKIQSKKLEEDKLSDKEKEDLDKLKDIEKDLNNTVGHLKFRMRKRCRACHFQTESASIMYHHKQFPHEDNKMLLCAHCNFATKQPMNYKFHMESEHYIQPRIHDKKFFYECNLCPYENNQEQKLTIHKQRCTKQFRPLFNLHPSCLSGAEINLCLENIFYKPLVPKNLKILQQKHLQQQAALAAAKKQQAEVAALAAQKNAQAALAKRQRPPTPQQQFKPSPVSSRPQFQPRLPPPPMSMSQVRFNSRAPIQPVRPTVASMLKDKQSAGPKTGAGFPSHQGSAPVGFEVCEICGGYVKDRKALRIHFFYAHRIDLPLNLFDRNQPPLYCATCCVRFWTANGLRKHLDVHAQEKRLPEGFIGEGVSGKCIACGQLVGNIVVHMRVVHNREIHHYINALMCMFCGASFNSHANVERHIKDVHGTIDIATGAVKMKGKLKSSPPMPKVVSVSPPKKPIPTSSGSGGNNSLVKGSVCVLCNLNFGRNVDLTRHCMRMHHTCMKCGMVVIDKASLLKHTCLSSPSGTRDCIMCSETGFHPAYYVKHLRDKHLRKFSISIARLSVPVIERWTKRSYPFKQVQEELVEISDSDEDDGPVAKFKVDTPSKSPQKRPRIGPASKMKRASLSNGQTSASETCDNSKEANEQDKKNPSRRDSSSLESPVGSKRKPSFDSVTPERYSKRRK